MLCLASVIDRPWSLTTSCSGKYVCMWMVCAELLFSIWKVHNSKRDWEMCLTKMLLLKRFVYCLIMLKACLDKNLFQNVKTHHPILVLVLRKHCLLAVIPRSQCEQYGYVLYFLINLFDQFLYIYLSSLFLNALMFEMLHRSGGNRYYSPGCFLGRLSTGNRSNTNHKLLFILTLIQGCERHWSMVARFLW